MSGCGSVDVAHLESVAAVGWRGLDTDRLGDWLLRAAGGWTGRANSVLPLGDPGLPLDAALDRTSAWYRERGLPPRFQVPLPVGGELDAALEARGWALVNPSHVMTGAVETVLAALTERRDLPPVALADAPTDDWLAAYHYRGGSLPDVAAAVLVNADAPVFASVVEGGRTVAIGRAVVDEGWMGLTAMEVDPGVRRRGLGRHLLRGLLAWARGRATCTYLQVAGENAAAIALYRSVGYAHHHDYRYRVAPS